MPAVLAIRDLPDFLTADDWEWKPFVSPVAGAPMWIGVEPSGTEWLVKAEGGFRSYRERTFAALAQELGISCQSSVLLSVPEDSPPYKEAGPPHECSQLAITLIAHHGQSSCGDDCPLTNLWSESESAPDKAKLLMESGIQHAASLIEGDFLAHFCGANERAEKILTPDHELVLIDNSQAFSTGPADVAESPWLATSDGTPSPVAWALLEQLAARFAALSDEKLAECTAIPSTYAVEQLWPIPPMIVAAREAARHLVAAL